MNWKNIVNDNTVRLFEQLNSDQIINNVHPAIASFAIEDTLATSVGESESPSTIRLWVHDKTVVLGIPDTRLPYIENGIQLIKQRGFQPIVRNSGGLAVALDKGVLNISLIFPNNKMTSIQASYDMMLNLIKEILIHEAATIKAYEIVGSYCPGDYDLSIDGIKFAGISQRRVKNGVSVQIYIDVCGDHLQRAELVKQFYQISRQNEQTPYTYPQVNPNVMGSLSSLLNRQITVLDVVNRLRDVINEANLTTVSTNLTDNEQQIYTKRLEQMIKRNNII